jgi:hypothetical protein
MMDYSQFISPHISDLAPSGIRKFFDIAATMDDVISLGVPYEIRKDRYRLSVPSTAQATRLIVEHPELFVDYEITKGNMDDVFLAVTGKRLVQEGEQK